MLAHRNITLENLAIGYNKSDRSAALLSGISAKAQGGEMIAVVGANGVGKSTLLRTIIGLMPPIEGKVLIEGADIKSYSTAELALIFGFVGTTNMASQNLTVFELVSLGRFPYTNWIGKLMNSDKEVIERSVYNVGLEDFMDRKLSEMSDGERQRANIARVLAQDSRYIVLDEPTAFLDLPNRYELVSLLREIVNNDLKTVIYTTHDLQIAIKESDKIWLLNKLGLKEGSPEDLMLSKDFSNQFPESDLEFDTKSGNYISPSTSIGKVELLADKEYYDITKLALRRLKLDVVNKNRELLVKVVEVDNGVAWDIQYKGNIHRFLTIYDLSIYIRRYIISDSEGGDS